MARQWRIEYEGALYHVFSRGNEKRDIVSEEKDYVLFLNTLGQMANRFDVEVHAYVVMQNHYHILLKTKKANLSKSMQWFGTTYTRRYNSRHSWSGHLFQGRFKSIVVEDNHYLLRLSCYIHRNPLRAGLVKRLVDYPWSSYLAYGYGKAHRNWLSTDLILSQFKGSEKHRAYRGMVQKYSRGIRRIPEDIRYGLFLGSKEFIDRIKSEYLSGDAHADILKQRQMSGESDAKELADEVASVLGCKMEEFQKTKRITKSAKDHRDLILYLLWEMGRYKGRKIGDLFGLGYSAVSRRAAMTRERIDRDKTFKREYKRIKSIIKL